MRHIHLLGAPGSGVSSLGKIIAEELKWPFFDTDNFVWFTDDALPYRRKRNTQHRMQLLTETLSKEPNWVLSGSLCGWGDALIPEFDLVIHLTAQPQVREQRIKLRETARYGAERLAEGGDLHLVFEKFSDWALGYDTPSANIRSASAEHAWLTQMVKCQVLFLDSTDASPAELWQDVHSIIHS
jgi:adenylate kinase family enzyme